jgi:hypothetical protein
MLSNLTLLVRLWLFIPFNSDIIQPQLLILLPTPLINLNSHIGIGIRRIEVLHIRICQGIVQDNCERMLGFFDLV